MVDLVDNNQKFPGSLFVICPLSLSFLTCFFIGRVCNETLVYTCQEA